VDGATHKTLIIPIITVVVEGWDVEVVDIINIMEVVTEKVLDEVEAEAAVDITAAVITIYQLPIPLRRNVT
jgi:hypothetical protein